MVADSNIEMALPARICEGDTIYDPHRMRWLSVTHTQLLCALGAGIFGFYDIEPDDGIVMGGAELVTRKLRPRGLEADEPAYARTTALDVRQPASTFPVPIMSE